MKNKLYQVNGSLVYRFEYYEVYARSRKEAKRKCEAESSGELEDLEIYEIDP